MPPTIIQERSDGALVEHRRNPDPAAFGCSRIQSRVLQRDGNPYPDGMWWDMDGEGWTLLMWQSPEVLRSLLDDLLDSQTLTPRG